MYVCMYKCYICVCVYVYFNEGTGSIGVGYFGRLAAIR